jgi:DNA primase
MYVWYRKKDEKVSNPQCWLGEHLVDTEKTVVLAEGMFDFLSVMRVYRNVLSPLMAGMNDNKLKRIGRFSSIVTMFDGDKAGDLARERVDQVLGGPGRRIKHLKLKAGQDGGNMAIEEVIIALDGVVDLDYHPTRLT